MDRTGVRIKQEEADPVALRASIGGRGDVGYYLIFRGGRGEVVAMIETVLEALRIQEGDYVANAQREDVVRLMSWRSTKEGMDERG